MIRVVVVVRSLWQARTEEVVRKPEKKKEVQTNRLLVWEKEKLREEKRTISYKNVLDFCV